MIIGYYGTIPLANLVLLESTKEYPIAEAKPALGVPSLQAVGGDLKSYELTVHYPQNMVKWVTEWIKLAETREGYLLTFGGEAKGRFVIVNIKEEFLLFKKAQIEVVKMTISLKEEGAFLWAGNYNPYAPPENIRRSAEGGVTELLGSIKKWLDKRL